MFALVDRKMTVGRWVVLKMTAAERDGFVGPSLR